MEAGYVNDNQGGGSSSRYVHQLLSPPDNQDPPDSDNKPNSTRSGGAGPSSSNQRPRGRPPGSKNKPKPPIIVTRDSANALRSHVLEVSAGTDIMESLNDYARRRGRGVCVFSGSGTVSNVTIRQPVSSSGSVVTLRGAFQILSLTGTVLPPPAPPGAGGLSIFLSGGQGQVVGGNIVGPLIATERVVLVTASFANAVFERLPVEEQAAEENTVQQVRATASQSSGVTGGGGSLPLFNVAPPAHNTYAFPADLSGWGASNAASRPPF
ncbi:AT-hook motif nuclear-localized protein [Heracleum sosnowskyi]|uniref:AT-hook motif nuclear-localized protein n=1 Tax=Heracleum sosnowskyi TaxID=360622 RepID=A0AAD8H9X6_9APIA|nr:AT-hook motif nuclear-localized protein [Heracleum sosnowskyi]